MRSSATRPTPPLTLVPREPGAAPAPVAPPESAADVTPIGTDLLLPPEIATRLAAALESNGYSLEAANTAQDMTDNISFHRIVGRSEAGTCAAALLYFDKSRVDTYADDQWFVYSLCIRIRKHFGTGEHDRLGIAFLAPEGTRFPDTWGQQGDDIADLNIVDAVRFRRVVAPAMWTNQNVKTTLGYVRDWAGRLDLRPATAHDSTEGLSGQRRAAPDLLGRPVSTPVIPAVFVSYSHKDVDLLDLVLQEIAPLNGPHCRIWTDRDIRPAADWNQTIERSLDSAHIVILLVSESFLASEYVQNAELNKALDAADEGKKKVLWVYAKKVMDLDSQKRLLKWQAAHDIDSNHPLDRLLPDPKKQQLFKIYDSLENCLKDLQADRNRTPVSTSGDAARID